MRTGDRIYVKRNGLRVLHSFQYVYGRGMLWHVNRAGPIKQLMDEAERVEGHLLGSQARGGGPQF